MSKLMDLIDKRLPIKAFFNKHFNHYYVPKNLNFFYVFGALALAVMIIQALSGLWLVMFYTPTPKVAFASIQYIMRQVNYGWLFRYMHSTGASLFFIVIYCHLYKALRYGSYQKPRELVWFLGVILFILLLIEAFLGYLLPWGQMSYWGAEVITSLFEAIPIVGKSLGLFIKGGAQVNALTLTRFYALHIIAIPFLLILTTILHIIALRAVGSNNPEGIEIKELGVLEAKPLYGIPFYPYFVLKDAIALIIFLMVFFSIVFFCPDMGGYFLEKANYIQANPFSTPDEIHPLWYMAPFYAILKLIPHKLAGIFLMFLAIFILFLMPFLDKSPVRSIRYKGFYSRLGLSLLVLSFMSLIYFGMTALNPFKTGLAYLATFIYFAYFLLMPIYSYKERCKQPPLRINRDA